MEKGNVEPLQHEVVAEWFKVQYMFKVQLTRFETASGVKPVGQG